VNRQEKKALEFRALHAGTAFVIPNPWDVGSARVLAALDSRHWRRPVRLRVHARTPGRAATLDEWWNTRPRSTRQRICRSPSTWRTAMVPIRRVRRSPSCALPKVGAVGGSIEDYDPAGHIYDLPHATERVASAAQASRRLDIPFTLTARAENHIRGNPDLKDHDRSSAGIRGCRCRCPVCARTAHRDEVRAVCQGGSKPVNVLAVPGLSFADLVAAVRAPCQCRRKLDPGSRFERWPTRPWLSVMAETSRHSG